MSLITYEFERAEHAGELKQFRASIQGLYKAYEGKEDLLFYFGGRLNINGVDIDGLILKPDAVVLIEFKNYSGKSKLAPMVNGPAITKPSKEEPPNKMVALSLSLNNSALTAAHCVMGLNST